EKEAPKCYIDLMKKCWDPNPDNRPNAIEIEKSIRLFKGSNDSEIVEQFEEAYKYKKANLLSIEQLLIHKLFIHLNYLILLQQVLLRLIGMKMIMTISRREIIILH